VGYLHIDNAYKFPEIFYFREVYCLEKIHGTSAHLSWNAGELGFFAGGASHDAFVALFDAEKLRAAFVALGHNKVLVHGEAYGGKLQGMRATYGEALRFAAFDVMVHGVEHDSWLSVPNAADVVGKLGLEFVHFALVPITDIDAERDAPSVQARRNGITETRLREGVVLRPPIELHRNDGKRIIAKHKRDEFMETKTPREVDPEKLKVLEDARAVAEDWVTDMRLAHVVDRVIGAEERSMKRTGEIVRAMLEDVRREGAGEIVWSKDVEREVGRATASLYKRLTP